MVRVQKGNGLVSVPLYLPADRAIPAAAVPAKGRFTRDFVSDRKNLQRERKQGVPGWLRATAYLTALALAVALIALLAWCLLRLESGGQRPGKMAPAGGPERLRAEEILNI